MKALTLHQPWASAIAAGLKRYETRSWSTGYRGPLAIHAMYEDALEYFRDPMPLGAVVCVVDLVACHRTEALATLTATEEIAWGDWSPGRFAWELANVRVLTPPVPARGAQGLWEWGESPRGLVAPQPGLFDG